MQMMKKLAVQYSSLAYLLVPGTALAAAGDTIPTGSTDIQAFFLEFCNVTNWIFAFVLVAAVIAIIFSGVTFYTSGGDESKVTKARKFLQWSLVGVAIVILSKSLIAVVGSWVGVGGITAFLCT